MRSFNESSIEDQQAIPPPIPAFSWRGALSPALLVPASIPPLALAFSPSNVLQQFPALKEFTAWMASCIPNINIHANSTQISEVALLVDCLVVALVPVLALVVLIQSLYNYNYLLRRHIATGPHPMRIYFLPILGVPFFVGAIAAMVMLPGDPSWARGYTTDRTFFYGFLAGFMPFITGFVLGTPILVMRLFINAYLFPPKSASTVKPNPSIERTSPGKPGAASHVKR